MFREGNYDVQEFNLAQNGMNQFISPDVLPPNFCYSLENIIPSPLGVGQVRYGTRLIDTLPSLEEPNPEFNIIKSFPFRLVEIDGNIKNQAILYILYYKQDLSIDDIIIYSSSQFEFYSENPSNYVSDTKVKINYTYNGVLNTIYSDIVKASYIDNTVTLILGGNLLPEWPVPLGTAYTIDEIYYNNGAIYSYDLNEGILSSDPLRDDLSVGCVPRATYFQKNLIVYNGVDNNMRWDGTSLNDIAEFLLETEANLFVKNDNNDFSFDKFGIFNQEKYFVGNLIQLKVGGINYTLTIDSIDSADNVVSITTEEELPGFSVENQPILFYQDKPPPFSYIYIAKDRLWALGPGPVSIEYREPNYQLRVFYSYAPNGFDGIGYRLFNETTKSIPSIEMSDKHNVQDNFEAICEVNGFMAFIGRNNTQIWGGYTPGKNGDFSWNSNVPVGILHGDLLIELDNDVYFVSKSGIKSFSTLNIAKQFSANSYDAVDEIVKKFSADAFISNKNYRKCVSFKYNEGRFSGFKISNNKIIASLFSGSLYSWFYLSGDFRESNCFMELDSQLYMFIKNKIFSYGDGANGSQKIYGDNNGSSLISINWIPGLIRFKGRKGYANKRYELLIDYPSSFIISKNNTIEISIFGDSPRSFKLSDMCSFEYRGDLIGEEPLSATKEDPEYIGFRLRKEYEVVNKRLKFTSSSFWLSISGYVMDGPIIFRKIKLFGIGERSA